MQEFYSDEFKKIFIKLIIDNSSDYYAYMSYIPSSVFPTAMKNIIKAIRKIREKGYEGKIQRGILESELSLYIDEGLEDVYSLLLDDIYKIEIEDENIIREKIEEWIKRERLINAIIEASEIIKSKKVEKFDEIPKKIEQALIIDTASRKYSTFSDFYSVSEEGEEDIKYKIKTGIKTLDTCLMGGYGKCEVHVVLGGAKAGKTTYSIRTAVDVLKQHKTVVHISFELKESFIKWKYVCSITGLTYKEVIDKSNDILIKKRLDKFNEIYNPKLIIKKFEPGKVDVNQIKGFINSLIYKGEIDKPDFIIIDYDALLKPTISFKDLYSNEGQKYIDLSNLANYFECAILVPSQTNREGWKKSGKGEIITSAEIADSGAKRMHCDSIVTLNPIIDNKMILYVDTVRSGISNVEIMLCVDMERNRMYEEIQGKPYKYFKDIEEIMEDDYISNNSINENKEKEEKVETVEDYIKKNIDFDF